MSVINTAEYNQIISDGIRAVTEKTAQQPSLQIGESDSSTPVVQESVTEVPTVNSEAAPEKPVETSSEVPDNFIETITSQAAVEFFQKATNAKPEEMMELFQSYLGEDIAARALEAAKKHLADEYKNHAKGEVIKEIFGDAKVTEKEIQAIRDLVHEGKLLEQSEEAERIRRIRQLDDEIAKRQAQLENKQQAVDPKIQYAFSIAEQFDSHFKSFLETTPLAVQPTDTPEVASTKRAFSIALEQLVADDPSVSKTIATIRANVEAGRVRLNDQIIPQALRLIEQRATALLSRLQAPFQPASRSSTQTLGTGAVVTGSGQTSNNLEAQYKDVIERVFANARR